MDQDLKTFKGVVYDTYRRVCILLGLTENDDHWDKALEEAATRRSTKQMRSLFAVMIVTCKVSDSKALW